MLHPAAFNAGTIRTAFANSNITAEEESMTATIAVQGSSTQFNTDRTYQGLWTITFSNPPINMFVPTTIVELRALMTDLEADPSVKVVCSSRRIRMFSSPISMEPRQLNSQRRWAFGATLCCDSRPRQS